MDPHAASRRTLVRRAIGLGLCALAPVLDPATSAHACDVCAVYTATEQSESRTGLQLGVAVQHTHFGTLKDNSQQVPNPDGQYLDSTITQLLVGYQLTPRVGVQVNLPIIVRDYRRPQDGRLVRDNVSGPGDLTLLARVLAHSVVTESSVFRFSLLGGLKLPSGDPELLSEELEESHHGEVELRHDTPDTDPDDGGGSAEEGTASGIHGHDLALGSGSVDGIVGGELYWSWHRAFVTGALQYAIRSEGAFDYRYANDLVWSGGPGAYLLLAHDRSLALQALLSGETKGNDEQAGHKLDDTAVTNLYVGPLVRFTWGTSLAAEAGAVFPVLQHETGLQIVADYRLRAAVLYRF
jgi:hypothetical protein